jgi:hypothetical protein
MDRDLRTASATDRGIRELRCVWNAVAPVALPVFRRTRSVEQPHCVPADTCSYLGFCLNTCDGGHRQPQQCPGAVGQLLACRCSVDSTRDGETDRVGCVNAVGLWWSARSA